MLNVNRLRILIEVASRGSFSAAAEALSYTQASVSQQIAALEQETGVTLLERLPRGVRLTPAGVATITRRTGLRGESARIAMSSRLSESASFGIRATPTPAATSPCTVW